MKNVLKCSFWVVLFLVQFLCSCAMAEDVSNTFVGTVDGKSIVAYLDYTYAFNYGDGFGGDIDAAFVSFDESGKPQHRVGVRITDHTEERTYSEGNGRKIDYASVKLVYDPDTLQFYDYYRVVEGATDWEVTFTEIDRETGIIKGSVRATLKPSKYCDAPYPLHDSVRIEGNFEFKTRSIHPIMEEYRAYYPDYAEQHDVEYYQSVGDYSPSVISVADNGDVSARKEAGKYCNFCHNSLRCHVCDGQGFTYGITLGVGDGKHQCSICHGTGICQHCR